MGVPSKIHAPIKPASAAACAALLALVLGACGTTPASTGSFQGEQKEVAQAISNLQSDVTAADQSKICTSDLASEVVARLDAAPGGCKAVIKDQLVEIDKTDLKIVSVQVGGSRAQPTATATVRSTYGGKTRTSTVSLSKQNGKWRLAAIY